LEPDLAFKKITIFLFPDGSKRTVQFKIPRFLPLLFLFFLAFGSVSMVWLLKDYWAMKAQAPRFAQLAIENEQQKQQCLFLVERITKITKKINELKDFDRKLKVMVNFETGEENQEAPGLGGSDPVARDPKRALARSHKDLVRSMHQSLDDLDEQVAMGEQQKTELRTFLESQKVLLASTPSLWPTKGWLSSRFGKRKSPFTAKTEFHEGIDISTRLNAPVVAPADGMVKSVGWNRGYGRMVVVDHGYGVITRYAHLQKALVKKGQYVKRGETIALVGTTGRSTGPHLHYEVHLNKVPVDPMRYILN
jgi:murein DD-endopeptidase MepM/ murein hydrolase activator NlpD